MRIELMPLVDKQVTVTCVMDRYSLRRVFLNNRPMGKIPTMLFKDLVVKSDDLTVTTNHLWVEVTKELQEANLREGSKVQFRGVVQPYTKGYVDSVKHRCLQDDDICIDDLSDIQVLENSFFGQDFEQFVLAKNVTELLLPMANH